LTRAKLDGDPEPAKRSGPAPDALTASVTVVAGACIAAFLFFANPYLEPFETYRLVNAACLLWIPCSIVILFFKQDLKDFGMTKGDRKFGLSRALIAIGVMLPLLIVASRRPEFKTYYGDMVGQPLAMVGYAARDGWSPSVKPIGLLYYEMGQGFYMFCWEFFFRGFLLFGLSRIKWCGLTGAVILQAMVFALLHWSIVPMAAKPPAEIASALAGGLILGWLAVRTKSFFYGYIVHWSISVILDLLLVASMLKVH
jgi:membrane protease YdiL (CAAX protease family)